MKAIRITFKNEDFASVSRSLVDLGIVFHVEPVDQEPVTSAGVERSPATNTRSTKKQPRKSVRGAPAGSGIATLRTIAERNRAASNERLPTADQRDGIPEDLSEKLLPYSDRPDGEPR